MPVLPGPPNSGPCTVVGNLRQLSNGVIAQGQVIFELANTGIGTAGSFLTYVPLSSPYDPDTLVSQTPGTSCIPYDGNLQCLMPGLAPGAAITVVWSWLAGSNQAKLVTVFFPY